MAGWSLELEKGRPPIRYGFSVVCVAAALAVALTSRQYGYHPSQSQLFDFAIIAVAWNAGLGPSLLAAALSAACFNYFFIDPLYSFEISVREIPHFLLFVVFATVNAWLVSTLRAASGNLSLPTRSRSTFPEQARAGGYGRFGFLPIATALCAGANFVADTLTTTDITFSTLYTVVDSDGGPFLLHERHRPRCGRVCGAGVLAPLSSALRAGPRYVGILNTTNRPHSDRSGRAPGRAGRKTRKPRCSSARAKFGKLNSELAKRARELETSNSELESFAYSVSHDLRAPLRHVVGFSELLQKQASPSLDEKSRRYFRTILESSKRMGDLDRRSAGVFQDWPGRDQKDAW